MKVAKISFSLLVGTLLLAAASLAGDTNKATLRLQEKVTVEGKQLAPGNYKLEWDGAGPDVQVNILRGRETVVTVPAHLVEQAVRNAQDAYGTNDGPDGSRALTSVYVGGKPFALKFEGAQAAQQSSSR